MKAGSIVAVKELPEMYTRSYVKWLPVQDEKTPYMLRELSPCPCGNCGTMLGYLEEGIIGYFDETSDLCGKEIGIPLQFLVELLPPKKIEIDEVIHNLSVA